jgi:hypothetical protein
MDPITNVSTEVPPLTCTCCSASVLETDQFCPNCGYPLHGTETEQYNFIYNRNYKQTELEDLNKKIRSATTTLYVLAGLSFVSGIVIYSINKEEIRANFNLIIFMVMAVLYVGLAIWCKNKPVAAIISGLVLYIGFQIILAFDDPMNLVRGIIWKILIIVYLLKGMKSAFDAQKIRKELNLE